MKMGWYLRTERANTLNPCRWWWWWWLDVCGRNGLTSWWAEQMMRMMMAWCLRTQRTNRINPCRWWWWWWWWSTPRSPKLSIPFRLLD
jgi:hypothetical protein